MKALIVDGYNAINKIPRMRKIMDENLREARTAITELAREYRRRCGGIAKLYIVFDGRDEYRGVIPDTPSEHVFSKKGKGDKEIIRLVRDLSKEYHVLVVSDDNFVRNNARAYNATIIKISEFNASAKGRHVRQQNESAEKINPRDASEINRLLKKHWNI